METKIQLQHPKGKKAIRMDRSKYDLLRSALLKILKTKGPLTHTEIFQLVAEDFKINEVEFKGSLEWHSEWVKLDLEARKEIQREMDTSVVKYSVFNIKK